MSILAFSTFRIFPRIQDSLIHPVSCHLGASAGGITLDNEDLAFGRVLAGAVGELSVTVKGKLLFDQHIGPGLLLGLSDLSRFLGASDHRLEDFQIPVKIVNYLISRDLADSLGSILIVQFGLGLPLKPGIRRTPI